MIAIERTPYDYGRRADHYRITTRNHAPPKLRDGRAYLYICVFKDQAKVGVTTDVLMRIATHEKIGGDLDHAYLILLDRAEAFRRETIIARHFGEPRARKSGEWFALEHLPIAVMLMRTPEFERMWWWVERQQQDFDRNGFDGRFERVTEWPKAAPEAEAA